MVTTIRGVHLLKAGAGGGKTSTILVAYAMKVGASMPGTQVAMAMTNQAQAALQQRGVPVGEIAGFYTTGNSAMELIRRELEKQHRVAVRMAFAPRAGEALEPTHDCYM